jgi:uncharacterized protein involved in exopolysaccharide biosynthesis/Mrp family chromosome partitioning ATPase
MASAPAPADIDLRAVGRSLWKKKWWVIIPTLVAGLVATFAVNWVTPRYKSEARILIEGRENVFLRPEAEQSLPERERIDQEAVASQVQLVLSRDLARQVIKQLKLGERPEFDPILRGISAPRRLLILSGLAKDPFKMTPEERVLEAYYERLTAYQVERSRVIAVEFQSEDPDLAAQAANAIAETYLVLQQAARQEQTRVASQWLAGEIEVLRQRVADAESRVEEFRAKSNLFVGPNNTLLSNQQLSELNTQLALARSQKAEAEAKAGLIRNLLRSGQPIEASDVLNSELTRRLSEQLATLRAQLAEQSSTLLPGHPRIKELRAQIADLERQLRREAERLVRSFENDARIAGARVETLSSSLDQIKRQAASSNEQDVQLRALEREAKAQRDLLEAYLAKYREATARDSLMLPSEARIISRAVVSNTPSFPKKVPIILLATLGTFLLSTTLLAASELLAVPSARPHAVGGVAARLDPDVSVPPPSEARSGGPRSFSWPRGREPDPGGGDPDAGEGMPPATGTASHRTAAVPAVAGSLEDLARTISAGGEETKRLAVVGSSPSAGAAQAALALGRALARDRRVILVDLATGESVIASASTTPGVPGIADLVRGEASFRQIITRDRVSRLHLIAAGGNADRDIAAAARLRTAVNALARTYDHVVLAGGALPRAPVERLALLAPRAILVIGNEGDEAADVGYERLRRAGFGEVTVVQVTGADAATAAA